MAGKYCALVAMLSLAPMALWSQEQALTQDQAVELAKDQARPAQLALKAGQMYLDAADEIGSTFLVLRLLRKSEAAEDPNVVQAISLLETKLDGYLVRFSSYPRSEKIKEFHRGILRILNLARTYREQYPRYYPDEGTASAIQKVFDYAQASQKGREASPPREP